MAPLIETSLHVLNSSDVLSLVRGAEDFDMNKP